VKLSWCNPGLRKPLSTRHTTTHKFKSESDPFSYISPHSNGHLWKSRGCMATLGIGHSPCTTQPYDPQRRLLSSPSLRGTIPWTRFLLVSSLLTTPRLVSRVLNQVCHIRLFSFALRVFSMKWSNRRSIFFHSLRFVLPRFLWTSAPSPRCRCFCVFRSIFQNNIA
jgi:hypothetical protein